MRSSTDTDNILIELTKSIVQKQAELNNYLRIANEQKKLYEKINLLKSALVESDSSIKNLLLYLKEAEQVLASAVYQSRSKLDLIRKAKPIPSELVIRYAHKISSEYGVCCPENWTPDNPSRPYPTDADMRKGWLAKINLMNEISTGSSSDPSAEQTSTQTTKSLIRSNSKMIEPIVPQEFGFGDKNNLTEFMSDMSSDSSNDSDNS